MRTGTSPTRLSDYMAIARVARWLWVHAGSPPGQYEEFWVKVERAVVAAQQAQASKRMVVARPGQPDGQDPSDEAENHHKLSNN